MKCVFDVFAAPLRVRYTLIMFIECVFDVYLIDLPRARSGRFMPIVATASSSAKAGGRSSMA